MILFENKGSENTKDCFRAVADRVEELGLNHVVVASTSGRTGAKAVEFFAGLDVKVTVVSHQFGYKRDGEIEMEEEFRKKIEDAENASLVVTPDVLTRVNKMVRKKYGGATYLDFIADTLRIFSEGMKVSIECSLQAADSGEIPVKEEIAVIAGTGSGSDTGIVLESQHTHNLFDIDVREIVCMPREK